jgi:hypothetical protein
MNGNNRDDIVLWIVISFCLITPVVLTSLWAYGDKYYPPMLMAVLLGIAVAALTYRYLGGTSSSSFSIGVLKVAGSAALLLGTTYITHQGFSREILPSVPPNRLAIVEKERDDSKNREKDIAGKLEQCKLDLEKAERRSKDILIGEIEKVSPSSDLGQKLADMAARGKGPFAVVIKSLKARATVIKRDKGKFSVCSSLGFAASDQLRLSRTYDKSEEGTLQVAGSPTGIIATAKCDESPRSFDIQIGCKDGSILFPEHILSCGNEGEVGWKYTKGERTFEVLVEVMRQTSQPN